MTIKDLSKYIPSNAASESDHKPEAHIPVVYTPKKGEEAKELDDDFEEVRKHLAKANEFSAEAIKEAIALAKSSDQPGAWLVVNELIGGMAKVNKILVDAHKNKIRARKDSVADKDSGSSGSTPSKQVNTQQNIFVGSPAELAELIKNGNVIDVDNTKG